MTRSFTLAVALAAALSPDAFAQGNPLAAPADPWAGSWTEATQARGLRVTLEKSGAAYSGAVEVEGQRFPLAASANGARVDGTFEVQGSRYAFALAREGELVVMTTDGMTYRLRRDAPPNPLAGGAAPAQPAASAFPDDWQRWRHPLGYELRFPPGWQLQETQLGLVFSPPDLARDAYGQPQELILMQGVPAQGVTKPDDPRAVQFVETSMRAVFPFLRRTGEVVVREVNGRPVAELTFSGTNPQGKPAQALSLLTILGEQSVLGHVITDPGRFAAREPLLRRIFASAGTTQAERDQRLVGTWSYESSTTSRDFSSTNVTNITFAADGRYTRGGQFAAGATQRQDGEETGRTLVDSGGVNQQTGTWAAGSGKLVVRWSNGTTEEWAYEVTGPNLVLKGTGQPRLYIRSN